MTTHADLVLRSDDSRGVCTLTLNQSDSFNALSQAMLSALQQHIKDLTQQDDVRVLIIAAKGKAFCAGHDLKEMRTQPSQEYYQQLFKQCASFMMSLQTLKQPEVLITMVYVRAVG